MASGKLPPVQIRQAVGDNGDLGQSIVGDIRGSEFTTLEEKGFETIAERTTDSKSQLYADLAFNEEMVKVFVSDQPDDMPQVFDFTINGENQVFFCGHEMNVKRKFVTAAFACKERNWSCRPVRDENSESRYHQVATYKARFPMEILHDPSPRNREYIAKIRAMQ